LAGGEVFLVDASIIMTKSHPWNGDLFVPRFKMYKDKGKEDALLVWTTPKIGNNRFPIREQEHANIAQTHKAIDSYTREPGRWVTEIFDNNGNNRIGLCRNTIGNRVYEPRVEVRKLPYHDVYVTEDGDKVTVRFKPKPKYMKTY
jgi:hypothetical protein